MRTGKFLVSADKAVSGELNIAGPQSSIVLRDDEFFLIGGEPNLNITGSLYDQTKITLIDCIRTSATSHKVPGEGAESHSVTLFPHFITQGRVYLDPCKPTIRAVSFTFEDAPSLFYDFDAFGSLIDAAPYIQSITDINAKKFERTIRTGSHPHIVYFTGQLLIVEASTAIGKITAQHCPTWPIGGPKGVRIDNEIWVSITPDSPVTFDDAINRMLSVLRFITIAVGRRQTVSQFSVDAGSGEVAQSLNVWWSNHPRQSPERSGGGNSPQPRDLPLNPIDHSDEFVAVLKSWLAVDAERRFARVRADDSFAHKNVYTVDRLVGAANAFDLLPESAVPQSVALSPELLAAKKQCKAAFRGLPESDERESLLRAIGHLGHAMLKQKVRHRANIITRATGNQYFQSLDYVCNQAVECRNHYVHGSPVKFDLEPPSRHFGFLTDALEFVFAASELIESGWDIVRFLKTGTSMTHPFGVYAVTYNENLQSLRVSAKVSATDEDP
jgi:hypothetical protein